MPQTFLDDTIDDFEASFDREVLSRGVVLYD